MSRSSHKQLCIHGCGRVAGIALLMSCVHFVYAQQTHAADSTQPPDSLQAAQRDLRFDVASIRPTDPQGPGKYGTMQPYTTGHYRDERMSLMGLAFKAFEIKHGYQMQSVDWMSKAWFSINATVPEGATKDDVPIMLRHLLEDRFALKYHHETRNMDGYELVVAKSGPKLEKSAGPPDKKLVKGMGFEIKDGVPQFDRNSGPQQLYVMNPGGLVTWWKGRDETIERLASDISDRVKVPVEDATGLGEEYDFSLNFIEENSSANTDAASTPSDYPTLREALKEQLGLELRPVKNVLVDVVIIDSANKQPSEN